MTCKVIISSISNTPKFSPSKWEHELNISCTLRIKCQFRRVMITKSKLLFLHSKGKKPVITKCSPILKPLKISIWLTEEFQFHLFEFSCSKNKITWSNLISKRLTNLCYTKRKLLSGSTLNILEVNKYSLCCLRAKIYSVLRIFSNTHKTLEHKIKLSYISKIMLTTSRTWNAIRLNKFHHLFGTPAIHRSL